MTIPGLGRVQPGKLKIKGRPPAMARQNTGRRSDRWTQAGPRVNQKANAAKLVIIYSIYA